VLLLGVDDTRASGSGAVLSMIFHSNVALPPGSSGARRQSS
jgi:hypothetical protein